MSARVLWRSDGNTNRRRVVLLLIGVFLAGPGSHAWAAKADEDATAAKILEGRELFTRAWIPRDPRASEGDGLGPVFNDTSCSACHNQGGVGGSGPASKNIQVLTLNGRANQNAALLHPGFAQQTSVVLHHFSSAAHYDTWRGQRVLLASGKGGDLAAAFELVAMFQKDPQGAARQLAQQKGELPAGVALAERNPTPLFGLGLVDAIPDKVLEAAAIKSKGRGRLSRLQDGRAGKFGWKGQTASLADFTLTACAVELGLEVPGHPQGSNPLKPGYKAPGLDLTAQQCDSLVAYLKALPAPAELPSPGLESFVVDGRKLFTRIGCAECHTPQLGEVEGIYSDLLLHDMGPQLASHSSYGVFLQNLADQALSKPQNEVRETEWRTPPLWGCRDSAPYMHDGRARTLREAILMHEGQGAESAARFRAASSVGQQRIISFLESLVAPQAEYAMQPPAKRPAVAQKKR